MSNKASLALALLVATSCLVDACLAHQTAADWTAPFYSSTDISPDETHRLLESVESWSSDVSNLLDLRKLSAEVCNRRPYIELSGQLGRNSPSVAIQRYLEDCERRRGEYCDQLAGQRVQESRLIYKRLQDDGADLSPEETLELLGQLDDSTAGEILRLARATDCNLVDSYQRTASRAYPWASLRRCANHYFHLLQQRCHGRNRTLGSFWNYLAKTRG